MIYLHGMLGLMLGAVFGHWAAFLVGAMIADIDHVYIYFASGALTLKNISWKRVVDITKHQEKYNIHSKSPLMHSFFGLAACTLIFWLFMKEEALFFAIGYGTHLLLDWPDYEVKYYLYPLKTEFKGTLPIWSDLEKKIFLR